MSVLPNLIIDKMYAWDVVKSIHILLWFYSQASEVVDGICFATGEGAEVSYEFPNYRFVYHDFCYLVRQNRVELFA